MSCRGSGEAVVIRVAGASDISAIISVVNAAYAMEEFLAGMRTDEERLAKTMERGVMLVAVEVSSKIVGTIHVQVEGSRGYFGMLAVEPGWQGAGIGRQMVSAAEDYCRERGGECLDIDVLSLRPDLLDFYKKLGYVETGTRAAPLSRKLKPGFECHAVLLSKRL